jgi:hypothetical protein
MERCTHCAGALPILCLPGWPPCRQRVAADGHGRPKVYHRRSRVLLPSA